MDFKGYLDQGNTLLTLNKYKRAEEKFSKALTIEPNSHEALYGLGVCQYHIGKLNESLKTLQKGVSYYPHYENFYDSLIVIHLDKKNYKEALETADEYLRYFPNSYIALLDKARVLMTFNNKKNEEEIFTLLESARSKKPDYYFISELLGEATWKYKKNFTEAKRFYLKALKEDPLNAGLYNNYGAFLFNNKHEKEAIEFFKNALRLNPTLGISEDNLRQAIIRSNPLTIFPARWFNFWSNFYKQHRIILIIMLIVLHPLFYILFFSYIVLLPYYFFMSNLIKLSYYYNEGVDITKLILDRIFSKLVKISPIKSFKIKKEEKRIHFDISFSLVNIIVYIFIFVIIFAAFY